MLEYQLRFRHNNQAVIYILKKTQDIFLGAFLDGSKINQDFYKIYSITDDKITVSSTLLSSFDTFKATKENMYNFVKSRASKTDLSDVNEKFSFKFRELENFNELKLYYRQNLNLKEWFSINQTENKLRTLWILDIEQEYFDLLMDIPKEGKLKIDKSKIASIDEKGLVYVSQVIFGKKSTILIESNLDKYIVKSAISNALKNKELSTQDKNILLNCYFTK